MSAKARSNKRIISSWGDCIVLSLQGGNRVEIYRPDGTAITKETNEAGKGGKAEPEKFEPAELFSTDNYRGVLQYANPNISVSASDGKAGKETSKIIVAVDKKAVWE